MKPFEYTEPLPLVRRSLKKPKIDPLDPFISMVMRKLIISEIASFFLGLSFALPDPYDKITFLGALVAHVGNALWGYSD